MASGDTLVVFTPLHNEPPTTNFATLDTRNSHPVLDFDKDTDESALFSGIMPRHYAGGGVIVMLVWMATAVTTNEVVWNAQFERHADDAFDLDSDGFAAVQASAAVTAPSASGEVSYDDITFDDGAEMDSVAAGESFRLKVIRDANNGADDLDNDAELLRVEIREA
jgi:hypothetical protein